jgi:hypothetical protein
MVKIVNRHGAPEPLIRYAGSKQYDSGSSDFTATSLIDEPRIKILEKKHADEIEDDPYLNPWKYLSTIWHALLADSAYYKDGEIAEERIFTQYEGLTISGAMDLQTVFKDDDDNLGVTIGDYKFCGSYALNDLSKWAAQLNIYAWLVEREKPHMKVLGLEVYAFIRDWRMASAERSSDYPQTPAVTIELPLWTSEERESYVAERVAAHMDARQELPECSHEGRWPSGKIWQVKDGDEVIYTHTTKREATKFSERFAEPPENLAIESTFATYRRCESFCPVSEWCDQYQIWKEER